MKLYCYFVNFLLSYLIVSLLIGCKGDTIDVSKLVLERDSLRENLSIKQKEVDNLNTFVQVVSEGLDSIAVLEGYIRDAGPEGTGMTRDQMKKSIQELADVLARQRDRIAALEDSLNLNGNGAKGLHNIVSYLNEQLTAKERTINQLRSEINTKNLSLTKLQEKISTLNEDIEKLNWKNQVQEDILVTQDSMMNECYMKIGTKKQLKEVGILSNRGRLNSSALTPDRFVRVDIRQLVELPINSKKPQILTTMPSDAYRMVRNSDGTSTLFIDNPTSFWSISNYLVILE